MSTFRIKLCVRSDSKPLGFIADGITLEYGAGTYIGTRPQIAAAALQSTLDAIQQTSTLDVAYVHVMADEEHIALFHEITAKVCGLAAWQRPNYRIYTLHIQK